MMPIFLQGFLLQASLILALGAQNIFVLNSGLKKQRHLLVALVSTFCDVFLIFVGVIGVASVFVQYPQLKLIIGMAGVGFLFFYGIKKIKEANSKNLISEKNDQLTSVKKVILTSLSFSLLNPHVYLDTVVLIGGYASKFDLLSTRLIFGSGASVFSIIWFFGLSLLSATLSRLLNNNQAMRFISLVSGLILIILSIKLATDVVMWSQS